MEKGEKANKRYVDEQLLVWRGGGGSHWSSLKYPVVHTPELSYQRMGSLDIY